MIFDDNIVKGVVTTYEHTHKTHGSYVTRGYMKNNQTGVVTDFQYNPESFKYSRGATYGDIVAPGISYPITQFCNGNIRSFSVELFFCDDPCTGLIRQKMTEIGKFLPPEKNIRDYVRPPTMTFVFGYFIRECVLEDLDISIEAFDINLEPTMARFTMQLRQVGV